MPYFMLIYRKKLLDSINYFIHLNLSITLLIALIVFALGIELGTYNKVYSQHNNNYSNIFCVLTAKFKPIDIFLVLNTK